MYCISVNYKNSDVNIRKKLAFSENVQKEFLTELINGKTVSECVILCTCNRTELYFCGNEDSLNTVQNLLSNYSGIEYDLLKKHLYLFYSDKAVMHLFRVVSGIESMVIGEDEILGQIKLAYTMAKDLGMTGYELNMTFQSAMACAKKIKTQTALSKTSVSTATLAGNEIAHFKDKVNVLVIGATGKIGTVLVKNLLSHKNVSVIATSRKHSAESVQTKANITIANYADRYSYMDSADCVVSATASPHYTVTYYDLKKNIKTDKPRLFIDLAVPPDIDGSVAGIKGLKLIGIDYFIKSLTTSPAIIRPTTDGTNAILPGTCRLCVHFLAVSGGQMQFVLQLIAISSIGVIGFSFEYTTLSFLMPRFLSSLRITLARGHTEVL